MTDDGAPPADPAPLSDTPPPSPLHRWLDRKKAARLVALAGVLALVLTGQSLVLPNLTTEHDVVLQLEAPRDVVGIDIRWSAPDSGDEVASTSLYFSPGATPADVPVPVHLPGGRYSVTITLQRVASTSEGGADTTTIRRLITLGDASRVTIPLR